MKKVWVLLFILAAYAPGTVFADGGCAKHFLPPLVLERFSSLDREAKLELLDAAHSRGYFLYASEVEVLGKLKGDPDEAISKRAKNILASPPEGGDGRSFLRKIGYQPGSNEVAKVLAMRRAIELAPTMTAKQREILLLVSGSESPQIRTLARQAVTGEKPNPPVEKKPPDEKALPAFLELFADQAFGEVEMLKRVDAILAESARHLREAKAEYTMRLEGDRRRVLVIHPEGESAISQLARDVRERYGFELVFDPRGLLESKVVSGYRPGDKRILLSASDLLGDWKRFSDHAIVEGIAEHYSYFAAGFQPNYQGHFVFFSPSRKLPLLYVPTWIAKVTGDWKHVSPLLRSGDLAPAEFATRFLEHVKVALNYAAEVESYSSKALGALEKEGDFEVRASFSEPKDAYYPATLGSTWITPDRSVAYSMPLASGESAIFPQKSHFRHQLKRIHEQALIDKKWLEELARVLGELEGASDFEASQIILRIDRLVGSRD